MTARWRGPQNPLSTQQKIPCSQPRLKLSGKQTRDFLLTVVQPPGRTGYMVRRQTPRQGVGTGSILRTQCPLWKRPKKSTVGNPASAKQRVHRRLKMGCPDLVVAPTNRSVSIWRLRALGSRWESGTSHLIAKAKYRAEGYYSSVSRSNTNERLLFAIVTQKSTRYWGGIRRGGVIRAYSIKLAYISRI